MHFHKEDLSKVKPEQLETLERQLSEKLDRNSWVISRVYHFTLITSRVCGKPERGALSKFQNKRMRLKQPDDETGCYLHLAVPNLIVHEIDKSSPLYPEVKRHLQGSSSSRANGIPSTTRNEIEEHLYRHNIEIVVLVEGFEPITAACTQGRQSYSHAAEDLAFDCDFAPCILRKEDGSLTVDFNRFQELIPAPPSGTMYEPLPENG
eukprot:symbB.v1.2.009574.t1/scaffold609.1/size185969/4